LTFSLKFIAICFLLNLSMSNIARSMEEQMVFYSPDNNIFNYSDYIFKELIPSEEDNGKMAIRFHRGIVLTGKGYGWDAPGARVCFRTNAKEIVAHYFYTDKHDPIRAHNSFGALIVDGKINQELLFSPDKNSKRPAGKVTFKVPTKGDGKLHTYELLMPYGDSVDFLGGEVNKGASFEKAEPRPQKRCLFYGDSVTHGFTASNILHTYPFLLTYKKNWQMLNMAIGGHASNSAPKDAEQLSKFDFDILVVALGVNDWQGKGKPETYSKNMSAFLSAVRKIKPDVPIYFISPLWVSDDWGKKIKETYSLSDYRKQLESLVEKHKKNDKNLHFIDGTKLIDHDIKLFDSVLVHPNDKGFTQMADRLSKIIK